MIARKMNWKEAFITYGLTCLKGLRKTMKKTSVRREDVLIEIQNGLS
jgi:hypothetical protein